MTTALTEHDVTGPAGFAWTDSDRRAVAVARGLTADAVERAGHGHPGTAISLAPAAHLLFQRLLRHEPTDPHWPGRDRFVLSCGHAGLTLYTQLYLSGYPLGLDDLKSLRTEGSRTPAHPEYGHTPGVETTTGPLGQGFADAVGMAMAARRERGLFDPDAAPGTSPFDHTIWAFASDGDLEEGISHEASSLAGHQQLGNPVVLWDDNRISIEDDTGIAVSENVLARYRAYGWYVQEADRRQGSEYAEDVPALHRALSDARAESGRPSLVALRTLIGWPSPGKQNSGKIHGSALGAPRASWGWTRHVTSRCRTRSSPTPARPPCVGGPPTSGGTRPTRSGAPPTPSGRPSSHGSARGGCRPNGTRRCPSSPPESRSPPVRHRVRCSTRRPECCPDCGEARRTWPSPVRRACTADAMRECTCCQERPASVSAARSKADVRSR